MPKTKEYKIGYGKGFCKPFQSCLLDSYEMAWKFPLMVHQHVIEF